MEGSMVVTTIWGPWSEPYLRDMQGSSFTFDSNSDPATAIANRRRKTLPSTLIQASLNLLIYFCSRAGMRDQDQEDPRAEGCRARGCAICQGAGDGCHPRTQGPADLRHHLARA